MDESVYLSIDVGLKEGSNERVFWLLRSFPYVISYEDYDKEPYILLQDVFTGVCSRTRKGCWLALEYIELSKKWHLQASGTFKRGLGQLEKFLAWITPLVNTEIGDIIGFIDIPELIYPVFLYINDKGYIEMEDYD